MAKKGKGKGKGKSKGKGKARRHAEQALAAIDGAGDPAARDSAAHADRGASAGAAGRDAPRRADGDGWRGGPSAAIGVAPGRPAAEPVELAARFANLAAVLQRLLARSEPDDGLTRARLSALALLVLGGPRTLGELAASERVRPPTMTRLVHAMEADGLVRREPHPSDGRMVVIRATARGQALLDDGRATRIAPLAEGIATLSPGERILLEDASDLLGRLLRDAGRGPDDGGRDVRDRHAG